MGAIRSPNRQSGPETRYRPVPPLRAPSRAQSLVARAGEDQDGLNARRRTPNLPVVGSMVTGPPFVRSHAVMARPSASTSARLDPRRDVGDLPPAVPSGVAKRSTSQAAVHLALQAEGRTE
jgi:hypothetical protein